MTDVVAGLRAPSGAATRCAAERGEVRACCRSPVFRGGASIARRRRCSRRGWRFGLRAALLRRGRAVHEGSRGRASSAAPARACAQTDAGSRAPAPGCSRVNRAALALAPLRRALAARRATSS